MGHYTSAGLYVPDIGEAISTWPPPVNENFEKLDRSLAAANALAGTPGQRVFVNKLSAAATDSGPNRGTPLEPYHSLDQLVAEISGSAAPGPLVYPGLGCTIEFGQGPIVNWAAPPFAPGTTFSGQAHRLTQEFKIPQGTRIEGQSSVRVSGDQNYYGTLIYGEVSGPLIRLGDQHGDVRSDGVVMTGVSITNFADDGIGLEMQKGATRCLVAHVVLTGCGSHGIRGQKNSADQTTFFQVMSYSQGWGSGGGNGLHLDAEDVASGMPNRLTFLNCRFRSTLPANGRNAVVRSPSGTGHANLFVGCSFGPESGILQLGAYSTILEANYFETGGPGWFFPAIELDEIDSPGTVGEGEPYWPAACVIGENYIHGSGRDASFSSLRGATTNVGTLIHARTGSGIIVRHNDIFVGTAGLSSTNPLLYFHDTETRACELHLAAGIRNQQDPPTGQVALEPSSSLYHSGHASNWGEIYRPSTNSMLKIGTWPS